MLKAPYPIASATRKSQRFNTIQGCTREIYTLTIAPGPIADNIERAHRAGSAWWSPAGRLFTPQEHIVAIRNAHSAISDWLETIRPDWLDYDLIWSEVVYPDQLEHHYAVTLTVGVDIP